MYTQFHQPASGSQERGRYLGGALMKNWTWPKGSEEDLAQLGCPALGDQPSLYTFSIVPPSDCSFQSAWKLADHAKKARILILTHMGLWLGAGHQNRGHQEMVKWGLPSHPAPSYPLSTKKMRQRTVRAGSSYGCSQLRYAHCVAAGQQSPT